MIPALQGGLGQSSGQSHQDEHSSSTLVTAGELKKTWVIHHHIYPDSPALTLGHLLRPGSCGVPFISAEGPVVEGDFGDPVTAAVAGLGALWGYGSADYFVGWCARKGSNGPAKPGPEHWAVGSSPVVPGQSRVPRQRVGDTGNPGKSLCSSSGFKMGPQVLQGAVAEGGKRGGGGGAGMQECGGDGGMAVGEVLGVAHPLPYRPMASQVALPWAFAVGVAPLASLSPQPWDTRSPWGMARAGGKLTVRPQSSSWAAECRSPKW